MTAVWKKSRMFKLALIVAILTILVWAAGKRLLQKPVSNKISTIEAVGVVEGREINIASKIAGRIKAIHADEGDVARLGDLLIEIDSAELSAAVEQAETGVAAAEATVSTGRESVVNVEAQLKATLAEEASVDAALDGAEARLKQAENDFVRASELFDKGILSSAEKEASETERDSRAAELAGARASLSAAKARTQAARTALRKAKADVKALNARVAEAEEGVKLAQARLADTRIISPANAVVRYRALEPGEVTSPGMAILTLVDTSRLWVRIDLPQDEAVLVSTGLPAEIRLEGPAERSFAGEVWDVALEGDFATERDVTRGRQDIRTFRTRVLIKDAASTLTSTLRPGMTVRVFITIPFRPSVSEQTSTAPTAESGQ